MERIELINKLLYSISNISITDQLELKNVLPKINPETALEFNTFREVLECLSYSTLKLIEKSITDLK